MANISYQFISADNYIQGLREQALIYNKDRYLLACALKDGVLVENDQKNIREYEDLLVWSSEYGYSWAKLKLADMLSEGEGDLIRSEPEFSDVCRLLKEATNCVDVCPPAWLKLGWMRALGLGGEQQNLEEAKKCCKEYGKNDVYSSELLSFIDRIEKNQSKNIPTLYGKNHSAQEQFQSGEMCLAGGIDFLPDFAMAAEYYKEAANAGSIDAEVRLGQLCYYGLVGSVSDYCEAAKNFRVAAEAGDDYSQTVLASIYYRGLVDEDHKDEAIVWYERAAEKNPRAQYELGVLYGQKGNEGDWPKAFQLLEKAAFHGLHSDAQCLMGDVYRFGLLNCESDIDKAVDLYRMSSEQGNIVARLRLEELGL